MENQQELVDRYFGPKTAAAYDDRPGAWVAGRDSLLGFLQIVLGELPARARLLCVGAGTGLEVESLARAFPQWHFTVVEPSAAMMAICRERLEQGGFAARCTFHTGFLESLPPREPYHGATCLLVSHFILDIEERRAFFRGIAARLHPGALLVSADLSGDPTEPGFGALLDFFLRSTSTAELSEADLAQRRAPYGRDVAILPPAQIATLLVDAGFARPTLFFQNLLIHAWYTRCAVEH